MRRSTEERSPLARAFLHSNTHTANALTIAAALGALDAYATEGVLAHVAVLGPTLRQGLCALASARPTLANVRGLGMVAAVDLVARDGARSSPRHERAIACTARR